LKQKIFGAKQHGFSRTLYRSYPFTEGGANLSCEVLLREIERRQQHCIEHKTVMPRKLLIQIDGGPDMTAKSLYGLCEYLVRKDVFDQIDIARLPVGHTHEDIDAMFGVLWRAAQGKNIFTPQEWKNMALSCFKQIDDLIVDLTNSSAVDKGNA
jgi:hypothetical protein